MRCVLARGGCRLDGAAVAARLRAPQLRCTRLRHAAPCSASPVGLATQEASPHVHAVQAYIEFTDCFQVVYYANYFRFCASARTAALGHTLLRDVLRDSEGRATVLSVTGGRLASPAVLGDLLSVRSHVVSADASRLVFRQSVSPAGAPPGAKPHAACDVTIAFVHARTGELLALPAALASAAASLPAAPPHDAVQPFADNATVAETRVSLCGDELGPGGLPSETDVLRWFERNRTDAIGGGAGLRALQAAGVLVVVTSVGPLRVDPRAMAAVGRGEVTQVVVRSGVVSRRKGTFFVFRQEAYDAEGGALLAQGEVTCACVSAADMKLSPAPPELLARLAAE